MKQIVLRPDTYEDRDIIRIEFDFDNEMIGLVKTLPKAQWSPDIKSWYVPKRYDSVRKIFQHFRNKAWVDYSLLKNDKNTVSFSKTKRNHDPIEPESEKEIDEFVDWMRSCRYSDRTIRTYTDMLKLLFRFYYPSGVEEISQHDLDIFIRDNIINKNYSSSFQNQFISSIKLFYKKTKNRIIDIAKMERPKRERKLPQILSKEEVKKILNAHHNLKHKSMLSLIYACGLRRSEVLGLKPLDLDSKRGLLHIRKGKGKKDRMVPLSGKIIDLLREYYIACKPKEYLFEGYEPGTPYSEKSLHSVLKQALRKCGIKKPVTLHWLRHSYATHLLESGTDIRYIQEILGHNSSRTTEIYTHVSTKNLQNIKSPFDEL